MRDEPRPTSTGSTGVRAEILSNIVSSIMNRYQCGELQVAWMNLNIINGTVPSSMATQEPFDNNSTILSLINKLVLVTPPSGCRQQSPCTIQPVLVAYDIQEKVIQKLGSNDQPWQVKANLVDQPNSLITGGIANYSNGQTQFTLFTLPYIGTAEVQFTLIQPNGVNRY